MYKFKRIFAPGFVLVESRPEAWQSHVKRFAPGTTPKNQGTLNLYLAGEFSFSIPSTGFRQAMLPGQTNLDISIDAFPVYVDAIEAAELDGCWRMCLSPADKTARWTRRIAQVEAGGILPLREGDIAIVLFGEGSSGGEAMQVGSVIYSKSVSEIASQVGARIAVARLL